MFRFKEEIGQKNYSGKKRIESIDDYWDNDYDLYDEYGWENRHEYESNMLSAVITDLKLSKVLELGSGPGNLADKIIKKTNISYHAVDGESAKRAHARRGYAGKIIVKDLFDSFDTTELDNDYDLVIANDFLEHIRNPSLILETIRQLTVDNAYLFISSPSWRMKHHFYYPGLFDYDNLVKFILQEGFEQHYLFESWAQHVPIKAPRLSSESTLPEGHIFDWNYYILAKKVLDD